MVSSLEKVLLQQLPNVLGSTLTCSNSRKVSIRNDSFPVLHFETSTYICVAFSVILLQFFCYPMTFIRQFRIVIKNANILNVSLTGVGLITSDSVLYKDKYCINDCIDFIKVKKVSTFIYRHLHEHDQQRFTIQSGVLTGNDTRWCSIISGSPLPE